MLLFDRLITAIFRRRLEAELFFHLCGQPVYRHLSHSEPAFVQEVVTRQRGRGLRKRELARRRVFRDVVRYYNPADYFDREGHTLERNLFITALSITRCPVCRLEITDGMLFERAPSQFPQQEQEGTHYV